MSELSDYEAVEYLEGLREDLKNDVIDEDLQALDRAIKRLRTEIKTISVSRDFELHETDNVEKCINKMYELFISKLLEEQLLEIKKCELRPEHKARITYEVKVVNDKQDYIPMGIASDQQIREKISPIFRKEQK